MGTYSLVGSRKNGTFYFYSVSTFVYHSCEYMFKTHTVSVDMYMNPLWNTCFDYSTSNGFYLNKLYINRSSRLSPTRLYNFLVHYLTSVKKHCSFLKGSNFRLFYLSTDHPISGLYSVAKLSSEKKFLRPKSKSPIFSYSNGMSIQLFCKPQVLYNYVVKN